MRAFGDLFCRILGKNFTRFLRCFVYYALDFYDEAWKLRNLVTGHSNSPDANMRRAVLENKAFNFCFIVPTL